jgi:glycine cleavage system H protein
MSDIAPKNGEYLDGKLWFHRRGTTVTLGLTTLAVEEVGAVERIEFPGEGDDFQKGEIVVTIDGTKGRLEMITPASGIVNEINETAKDEPDMVSEDPFEEGWLIKLDLEDTSELKEYI